MLMNSILTEKEPKIYMNWSTELNQRDQLELSEYSYKKKQKKRKGDLPQKSPHYRLAYKYKKMIYNKKIRKILQKKPATAFGQFLKEKKGLRIPKGEKAIGRI